MKKNNFMMVLLAAVIIISTVIVFEGSKSKNNEKSPKNDLVGVWQDMPVMGSGWSNRYHFYQDGNYSFVLSQMDCESSERQIDGTWKIENGKLTLKENLVLKWENGKKVKATGSCGTKNELINYETNFYASDKTDEGIELNFQKDENGLDNRMKINLGNSVFWKYYDDPNVDSPAPIGGNVKSDN